MNPSQLNFARDVYTNPEKAVDLLLTSIEFDFLMLQADNDVVSPQMQRRVRHSYRKIFREAATQARLVE